MHRANFKTPSPIVAAWPRPALSNALVDAGPDVIAGRPGKIRLVNTQPAHLPFYESALLAK